MAIIPLVPAAILYFILNLFNSGQKRNYNKGKGKGNETRHRMKNNIEKGVYSNQAKAVLELLQSSIGSVAMNRIIPYMKSKGYSSRSYYDLLNALVDSGKVKKIYRNGVTAYTLKNNK